MNVKIRNLSEYVIPTFVGMTLEIEFLHSLSMDGIFL